MNASKFQGRHPYGIHSSHSHCLVPNIPTWELLASAMSCPDERLSAVRRRASGKPAIRVLIQLLSPRSLVAATKLRSIVWIVGSRAILRMDMGFYMGIM